MNEIVIYRNEDNLVQVEVRLADETVWLTQPQIVTLFDSSKANISEHIRNIANSGELDTESTVRKFRTVQTEGVRKVSRERLYYNLDMIISIGYRVNSKRGTQFRIWANNVLKQYLIKGFALNEKRLSEREKELQTLKTGIELLERTVAHQAKQLDQAKAFVNIIADFSKGLKILDDYDNERLDSQGITKKQAETISYEECHGIIGQIRDEFNSALFGKEKDDSFKSSIGQIYQSFGGNELYPSIEEKAAILLYLIVKNHSFIDGNKRIAAALFLYFLNKNGILYRKDKSKVLDGNTLASITLMIAESNPGEMETIKKIIMSILNRSEKL
jgi:prophage maintenance system killer protein/CII-binding regulator of phage lambda lysogenization HflD